MKNEIFLIEKKNKIKRNKSCLSISKKPFNKKKYFKGIILNETKKKTIGNKKENCIIKKFINVHNFQPFFNIILSLLFSRFSFIIFYLIIVFLNINLSHNIVIRKLNSNNNITLRINSKGDQRIISDKFTNYPETIIINELVQDYGGNITYNLTEEINNITIIWNNTISSCKSMFEDLSNIIEIDLTNFDSLMINDASNMFKGCSSLTSINFKNFNTESITTMSFMFHSCNSLVSLDLSSFNTSKVTTMYGMFLSCTSLKSLNLSSFDTSNVGFMHEMFLSCKNLLSLNLCHFNTVKVTDMHSMFQSCSSLVSLNLNNFDTSIVTSMRAMFVECSSLISLDLSSFNTSQVTNMNTMFRLCSSLKSLDLNNFNTSKVCYMGEMFSSCYNLTSLLISKFDTSSVSFMSSMFYRCNSLNYLNLSNFDTSSVIIMNSMFYDCKSLNYLDISNFDTSSVTTMNSMFYNCKSLKYLNLSNFNTSKVSNMEQMFWLCESLLSLNLSNFNTKLIKSTKNMFKDCMSLKYLYLDNFDTSQVNNMNGMFSNCRSLVSLNLKNFNLTSIQDAGNMFSSCKSLTTLDLSNFNNANPTTISEMFSDCESLISLDISNFNVSLVVNMNKFLYNCKSLISLNLMNFDKFKDSVQTSEMFYNCNKSLRYCINEEKIISTIFTQLEDFPNFNCSDDCFTNSSNKFILEKRKCIDNCSNDNYYKYEYDSICYHSCPNGTHSLRYNEFLCKEDIICDNYYNYDLTECLDEIPLGYYLRDPNLRTIDKCNSKCLNCTLESNKNGLCISCNINESYYPKYNDSSNNNSFINCYKDKNDNYYFDESNSIYMPCYSICKECNWKGDDNQNNCTKCYDNYILNGSNCEKIPFNTNTELTLNSNTDISFNTNEELTFNVNTVLTFNTNVDLSFNTNTDISFNSITDIVSNDNIDISENIANNTYIINNTSENLNESEFDYFSNDSSINSIDKQESSENINNLYITNNATNTYLLSDNIKDSIISYLSFLDTSNSNIYLINNDTIQDIEYYINEYLKTNNIPNFTFYYYEINLNENEIDDKYSNFTYIEFPPDSKNILIKNFNLDRKNDKIYVLIIESLYNDTNSAVKNFDYKLFLENGAILDIKEDIFAYVYSPLIDLNLSNYNYSIYFAEQGYDIYNKIDKFYYDTCSPAYLYNNDITIQDRKKDIYPNNVILCKDNCNYKAFNIEEKRIICDCNLNINNNYTNYTKINDFLEEDNGNFLNYFLDYINYKILKCYNLLTSFENIKKNYAFYCSILILTIIFLINILFWECGITKIRKIMISHIPTFQRICNDFIGKSRNNKINNNKKLLVPPKKKNKRKRKNVYNKKNINKKKIARPISFKQIDLIDSSNIKIVLKKEKTIKGEKTEKENYNFNELPFTQAIIKDKRNIFTIFISVIIQKLELVNLIIGEHKIKIVLIYQYILSLLTDLFFNAFLYTDEIVSNKYHNNGKLDFIVSLALSLLSNIINSIICYFLNFSKGVEERLEQILEIKIEFGYLFAFNKFIKILKIKVMLYFFIEILIICFCTYYIIIFCIIYYNSQISLLINYLMSSVESLILSIIVSILIAITRKIGIYYLSKNIYNTSKYLDNAF